MNKTEITAKVEARGAADELFALGQAEVRRHGLCAPGAEAYWQRLHDRIAKITGGLCPFRIVERGPHAPMTEEECQVFEREAMIFGKHSGVKVSGVPLDYLIWLDGEPDFRRKLNRYLRSERIQREQA